MLLFKTSITHFLGKVCEAFKKLLNENAHIGIIQLYTLYTRCLHSEIDCSKHFAISIGMNGTNITQYLLPVHRLLLLLVLNRSNECNCSFI